MTLYKVRTNESPAAIARRFRVPMSALIAANPHKPTKRVGNTTTWQGLRANETVRLPSGAVGTLGDFLGVTPASPSAPHVQISRGSGAAADVALWQTIIGVTPDGIFGSGTEAATKAWQTKHGLTPDGIVGPRTWAAALGSSATAPTATATPTAPPSGLTAAARAAAAALSADPNYCVSVARVGTAVNTTVHNFKAAWNSANPTRPVPIGTGKYEPVVASALSETLGGATVPPGCGAAAASAPVPAPAPAASATPAPAPAPAAAPAAPTGGSSAQIAAATAMNTALSVHGYKAADQPLYSAFQRSVGLKADGFPGTGTMSKLQSVLASAGIPMASVKVYPWRAGAYDGVNAPSQTEWTGAPAPASKVAQTAAQTAQAAAKAADSAPTATAATQAATAAAAAANTAAAAAAAAPPADKPAADAAAAAAASAAQAANTAAQQAGGGSAITPPEAPKKLSTGAIVAGAVGAAALVGIAAMAMGGGKKGHRRASGGHKRKTSKRKSSHGKRKSKKRK